MKKIAIGLMIASSAALAMADAVDYVDPMIGTDGWGTTYPGPVWPMGMIQPGPDTAVNPKTGDYGSSESGYRFRSDKLLGFTQTHVSGMGCCDMQDFLLLPFVGEMPSATNRMLITIDKRTEKSSPGYYAVEYADQPVKAELTCSRRVAYHRYTFAKGGRVHVFVDLQAGPLAWWRKNEPGYPKSRVVASEATATTEGVVEAHNVVTCWENNRNISCRIAFSPRPVAVRELADNGRAGKRWVLDFDLKPGAAVIAKAAISGVDIAGARANFADDPDDFDFEARRKACCAAWEALLSRVRATGPKEQLKIFYSALYHAYVHPTLLSDADGRVRFFDSMAHDVNRHVSRVTRAEGFEAYTNFSEWDTFRAAHPLHTILTPNLVDAFMRSRLLTYKTVGMLPKIQMFGGETYCMIGLHSIPMITDAVLKGLTTVDARELLKAEVASLAILRNNAEYDRLGYIPHDNGGASVSRTLEWGIDDWSVAKLAEHVGDRATAELAHRRAQYYRNLYDPTTGCMRARSKKGEWRTPFDPYKQKPTAEDIKAGIPNDYTEGGAWQYTGHVLQDVDGLVALHGGAEGFAAFLGKVFSDQTQIKSATPECSGRIGQFALGNEHDQHVPYLWQYAKRPDRTAEIVRELCEKYYSAKPNGICGNDDCGQMSAWYVFACLGFYPVNPCGGEYVLGAPQLPHTEIKLENGRIFTIIAKNLSKENLYVKSVTLNGKPFKGFLLKHSDIMAGGELVFEMTNRRETFKASPTVNSSSSDAAYNDYSAKGKLERIELTGEYRSEDAKTIREATGCPAFTVVKPRPLAGPTVKAVDFGFSPKNDDNAAAINAAIAAAKRVGARRLELAPGVYNCFGEKGIFLEDFDDFVFDGKGAELIFRRPPVYPIIPSWDHDGNRGNFVIRNCHRIEVGNLDMDWDWKKMPLATCARCVGSKVDEERDLASYIDFELVGYERHPLYGRTMPVQKIQGMSADFRHFSNSRHWWAETYEGGYGFKSEWLSPTRIRIYPGVWDLAKPHWDKRTSPGDAKTNRRMAKDYKVGETVRIKHCYYGKGAFTLDSNEDVDLHDLKVYACFGWGIYITGSQHRWSLRNASFMPRDWRHPCSSSSDTIHFARSRGETLFDNVTVGFEDDDALNAHDRFTVAKRVADDTLEVILKRGARYFLPGVGNEVELRLPGYGPTGWFGRVKRHDGERIVFDRPLPKATPPEGWFLVFDRTDCSDRLILRNSRFEDMEMRVLINVSDVTVENCTFRRTNGDALRMLADYTLAYWCEGMGTTNVLVRNCNFENNLIRKEVVNSPWSLGSDIAVCMSRPPQVREEGLYRDYISQITVENCRFKNSLGYFADLRFGRDFILRGNTVVRDGERSDCRANSGSIHLENVENVLIENNVFKPRAGTDKPAVFAGKKVKGVTVRGNRVSDCYRPSER